MVTRQFLQEQGYTNVQQLEDGTWVGIQRQFYTMALVVGLSEIGYEFRYCYEFTHDAIAGLVSMKKKEDIPVGPWIKRKGEGGEMMGPGAKDERGDDHTYSIFMTLAAIVMLGLFFMAGYDIGKRNLVIDIDTYGCEKVIAKYHGIEKK